MTNDEKDMIINFGAFNYPPAKMANIIDMPEAEISKQMAEPSSEFRKLYDAGKDKADYVIDMKLFDLAQTGDLKALEEFENRKSDR